MSTNVKLLLAAPVAILFGVLLYFLTEGSNEVQGEVLPSVDELLDESEVVELRDPEALEREVAQDYMDDRWGHLGDAGQVSPVVDTAGDVYFVEPRIYRARINGKVHYFRGISKPEKLGPTVRASEAAQLVEATAPLNPDVQPRNMAALGLQMPPIEDPNEMPPNLRDEHPLSPDYQGPGKKAD